MTVTWQVTVMFPKPKKKNSDQNIEIQRNWFFPANSWIKNCICLTRLITGSLLNAERNQT